MRKFSFLFASLCTATAIGAQAPGTFQAAAFSSDGKYITIGLKESQDSLFTRYEAQVHDLSAEKLKTRLRKMDDNGYIVKYSPDNNVIAVASADHIIYLWNASNGKLLKELNHQPGSKTWSLNGRRIITNLGSSIWNFAFSPDGNSIVSAYDDTVRLWDVSTAAIKRSFTGHKGQVWSVNFSPDGKKIVTSSSDKTAIIWDAVGSSSPIVLSGHTDWLISATFSPDGKTVLTGSRDKTARTWDANTGAALKIFEDEDGHSKWLRDARFSAEGERILTIAEDNKAIIWETSTGDILTQIDTGEGENTPLLSATFSPDGTKLLTVNDETGIVWDLMTGDREFKLEGFSQMLYAIYSPDGKFIVTGDASVVPEVKLWNAETGDEIRSF